MHSHTSSETPSFQHSEFWLAAVISTFGLVFVALYFVVVHKTVLLLLAFVFMLGCGFVLFFLAVGKIWTHHMYSMAEMLSQGGDHTHTDTKK